MNTPLKIRLHQKSFAREETKEAFEYLVKEFTDGCSGIQTLPDRFETYLWITTSEGRRALTIEVNLKGKVVTLRGLFWKEEIEGYPTLEQEQEIESCCCSCLELLIFDLATFKLLSKPSDGDGLEGVKIFELNHLVRC